MPNAISLTAAAFAVAVIAGCSGEQNADQNVIITNSVPPGAEVEALPPDESVDPAPEAATDGRTPQERGDGDDMVRIIDDTSNEANKR